MGTVVDFSAGVPPAAAIRDAGHIGAVRYVSPPRAGWMTGKPATRGQVDEYTRESMPWAAVWQYGKSRFPDVMRGRDGGVADAKAAQAKLEELGAPGKPVFFAVDFDISRAQWATARAYFEGVNSVIGAARTGIYGGVDVCRWAADAGVIGDAGGGRVWAWQTRSWSRGERFDRAVLFQRVIDAPSAPGPRVAGVTVDVNDVLAPSWGQNEIGGTHMTITPHHGRRGDPVWLPEVLRAFGVTVREYDGWKGRGQGDFAEITGVICHHTGGPTPDRTGPGIIAHGHSALRGLLSQIHLGKDGVVTIVGAGIAYHAGSGVMGDGKSGSVWRHSASGTQAYAIGNANAIGIEAQNSGSEPWPEVQRDAYVRTVAAICWYLGLPVDTAVQGHKEYVRPAGRKTDPSFDMNVFRREVSAMVDNPPFDDLGEDNMDEIKRMLADIRRRVEIIEVQLIGPAHPDNPAGGRGWPVLGANEKGQYLTLVDSVGALRRDVADAKGDGK